MKKTQIIELFKCIKKTKTTLFSIMLFIASTVIAFYGLSWTADAVLDSADDFYKNTCFRDTGISYVYGIDDDLIKDISKIPEVEKIEPVYMSYQDFDIGDKKYKTRVISLTEDIDVPTQVEGKLPTKKNEIAIDKKWAIDHNIQIGSTICFNEDNKDATLRYIYDMDIDKIEKNGYISELNDEQFVVSALIVAGSYLCATYGMYGINDKSLMLDCVMYAPISSFNLEAYSGYSSVLVSYYNTKNLNEFSDEYKKYANSVLSKIDDICDEYAKKRYRRLITNAKTIENYLKSNIEDIETDIIKIESSYKEKNANLGNDDSDEKNIKENLSELLFSSAYLRKNLDSYTKAIENLKDYHINNQSRKYNESYVFVLRFCGIFNDLKYSIAILFLIVGILVSYCSISRLVYEESLYIGTKKALGIYKSEIMQFYFVYVIFACLIGIIIGALLARFFVEPLIFSSICEYCFFNNIIWGFSLQEIFIFSVVVIIIQILTVYFACNSILKIAAKDLLSGIKDNGLRKHFYDNFWFFKKLPLFTKIIINNFFTDKRRVLSTIVTITGCTALLVSSFSLNNFIADSFSIQYKDIYDFDTIIYIKNDSTSVQDKLDSLGLDYAEMFSSYIFVEAPRDENIVPTIFVFKDNKYEKYINLLEDDKKQFIKNGIWSSCSYKYYFDVRKGDIMKLKDDYGKVHNIPVEGFFDYYLTQSQLFTNRDFYEKEFDKTYTTNALLLNSKSIDKDILRDKIRFDDNFEVFSDYYAESKAIFASASSVMQIVISIYISIAFLLAFLGLLNLFVMFIEEKKSELIILMINGYKLSVVKKYVYQDVIFLTFVSLIIGSILGVYVGNLSMKAYLKADMYFTSGIDIKAIICGIIITIFFVVMMCLTALKRIDKFKLTEINST